MKLPQFSSEKYKQKNLFKQLDKIQSLVALKDDVEFVVVGEHVQGISAHGSGQLCEPYLIFVKLSPQSQF